MYISLAGIILRIHSRWKHTNIIPKIWSTILQQRTMEQLIKLSHEARGAVAKPSVAE